MSLELGRFRLCAAFLATLAIFASRAHATNSAGFVKLDNTTEGSWQGNYGTNGYYFLGATASLPSYAQVSVTGASTFTWASSTSDPRALQIPSSGTRVAATWYASNAFYFSVNLQDGNTHQVAVYALDYDSSGRAERIDILDGSTGATLDSRSISGFVNGQYLVWNLTGNVTIRVTELTGNAVASGLFFDPASQVGQGPSIFAGLDTVTEGNWQQAYGADGYDFVGAGSALPSYAQLAVNGGTPFTWSGNTTDGRALQIPGSTSRVAATWYASGSFTFSLNLTDSNTHQVAFYALDFDDSGRSERFDIVNTSTGAVLDSRTISSFSNGQYLVWNLSGNVTIRVTQLAGPNAVVSGIFFGGVPQTTGAKLSVSTNTVNLSGAVGGTNSSSQTVNITNTGTGNLSWTATKTQSWLTLSATSGTAPAGLTIAASLSGLGSGTYSDTVTIAAAGASGSPQSITVTLSISANPPVLTVSSNSASFSATAGGANPPSQTINISNSGAGTLGWTASNTQSWLTLSAYSGTGTAGLGLNVSISGLSAGNYSDTVTISASGAANSPQTVTVTLNIQAAAGNAAAFVRADITTQGTWQGVYGSNGYNFVGATASVPSYAQMAVNGASQFIWSGSTSDPRALQMPNGNTRVAATWYASPSFAFNLNFTDGKTHQVALYALDYDGSGRSEQISVLDGTTGATLDNRSISSFSSGEYLVWNMSGNVTIKVTQISGNAVVSGLFFDAPTQLVPGTASFVSLDTKTEGGWQGVYGSDGYDLVGVTPAVPTYAQVTPNGAATYTWLSSTSDPRALQLPNGSSRIASTWYASGSFTYNINIIDGNTHQLALYALDYDYANRSEQITIVDASTGSTLDSRSLSNFGSGVYAIWNISGDVIVKVTQVSGTNAVVSGLFFGGAPQQITPPALSLSGTSVSFSGVAGGSNPASQGINITNTGGGSLSWTASKNQSWLTLSAASGTAPSTLTLGAVIAGLSAGNYSDTVTVAAAGATGSPQAINVSLSLTQAPPTLTISSTSATFTGVAGGSNPAGQNISISNSGSGSLSWTASNTQSWLTLSSTSGTAPASLGLNVSTAGLSPGTYTDTVTITAAGASGSPQTVSVTLTVNPGVSNSAAFVKLDTVTEGNWIGVYGGDGYDLVGSTPSLPSYAQVSTNGPFLFTWAGTTTDTRALQLPGGSGREAATWYGSGTYSFSVNLTDGAKHQFAMYAVDFDNSGRAEQIEILDGSTGAVLDTRSISAFNGGNYLVWNITGSITVRVSQVAGPNAVVSGLFFDTAGATPSGLGLFNRYDTTTRGTWTNAYGVDGYDFVGAPASLPPYAQVTVNGASTFTWASPTTDPRAMILPDASSRVAATWYSFTPFSFTLNLTDANTHQVALYAVDYDSSGRSQQVNVIDTATGLVLDTHTMSSFTSGQYLVWDLSGNVTIQVTPLTSANAVVSGLFFGGPPAQILPPTIVLSASSVSFSALAGSASPSSQSVVITNGGTGSLGWKASKTQSWLTLSATSGTTPSSLSIGANTAGLSAGVYTDTVTIAPAQGTASSQTITVTLNVRASPALLNVTQAQLTFISSGSGNNPTSQLVTISNTGTGTMTWSAAYSQKWVTLSSTSGTAPTNLAVGVTTNGLSAGIYTDTIVITAPGAAGSPFALPVTLVVGSVPGQFFVSPQGSPAGDGSINNPWDLQTALYQPTSVQPGNTIWIRGGTYGNGSGIFYSHLVGTATNPIIVRQFPGERATIDGWLQVGCCDQNPQPSEGAYIWFWGLEFASSITNRTGLPDGESTILDAVDTWAPGTRFINNAVHDSRVGISMWKEAVGSVAYGNVDYFNGFQASDRGHGHGFYVQNQTNTMTIDSNIVFDQFDEGMQFYGTGATYEKNLLVQNNISFNNGAISAGLNMADDVIFVNTNGVSGVQLLNNYFYFTPALGLGYNEMGWPGPNQNIVATGNYFMGGFEPVAITDWASVVFQNNTVYTNNYMIAFSTVNTPTGYTWDNNTYYGNGVFSYNGTGSYLSGWQSWTGYDLHSTLNSGAPSGVWTFVVPNKYEANRANIAVYNWSLQASVAVDVSSAITPGTRYKIIDAQNYFGPPLVIGTYDGNPITIPMSGLTIATPNGSVPTAPTHTAPQFGAFVLVPLQ